MTLTDARALLPTLRTRPADPEADAKALGALAEWCGHYTPWTNSDGADGLWLDITGCAHLFGGEQALMQDLVRRLEGLGYRSRLGLAETPGAAWAMARFASSPDMTGRIIEAGGVRKALAPLSVDGLRLSSSAALLLKRLGLRTIGQFYGIPRAALARRFRSGELSDTVLIRLDQALGERNEPLSPLLPAPPYRVRIRFADPVLAIEGIEAILDDSLTRLCETLGKDRKGARKLSLAAYRVDGSVARVSIAAGWPSRDAGHFKRLFADKLEAIDPGFGIEIIALGADAIEPLTARQLSLNPEGEDGQDEGLAQLVDRLSNRLGAKNVSGIVPRESYIPERADVRAPPARAGAPWPAVPDEAAPRPFRLFERPEPIRVTAEIPDGPPLSFVWRRVVRRVARAQGPERIAPEWWNDFQGRERIRDYYQVEDAEGRRYWLFREGLYHDPGSPAPPAWYIHGLFS